MSGPETLIFLRVDKPLRLLRRPSGLIEVEFAANPLDYS